MLAAERSGEVSIPELCRAAWPPNPARVREALQELVELGLVDLRPLASGARLSPADRDLVMATEGGTILAGVRQR
jgi:hypothetical protein